MNSARIARLTEGMNLGDIQREMNKLGDFRTPPAQFHTMENGVEVIYVKNSGLPDLLKRLIMSDDMKADQGSPLANLILTACQKIGVDISDNRFQNIREILINGNGSFHAEMDNLVALEVMVRHISSNGF